jgi:hypothetical protein
MSNTSSDRAVVLKDAAGNMYVIPAVKVNDALVSEKARDGLEKQLGSSKPGSDFELVGTYELPTELRRASYARPVIGPIGALLPSLPTA